MKQKKQAPKPQAPKPQARHLGFAVEPGTSPIDLDALMAETMGTLHTNYVGYPLKRRYFAPNEYTSYILARYRYRTLTLPMLVRSLQQFTADMHDPRLKFTCTDWADYKNTDPHFSVRAYKDVLYVTAAKEDSGLIPGDVILELDQMSPARVRWTMHYNAFYSREPERELWADYLATVQNVKVRHTDGSEEVITLQQFPKEEEATAVEFRMLNENTSYLRIERMDTDAIESLVTEHQAELEASRKLILDLRRNIGGEDDAGWSLFPYLVDRNHSLNALMVDEGSYVNFSKINCELRYHSLNEYKSQITDPEQLQMLEDEMQLFVKNYNKGQVFVAPYPFEDVTFAPAEKAPEQVIVLTDTFCEKEGEQFVSMCSRCGNKVKVIGRPTMGTLDFFDNINLKLNDHMTLSYPIRMTKAAHDGRGISEKGLPVDRYITWTPAEIKEDVILNKALEM